MTNTKIFAEEILLDEEMEKVSFIRSGGTFFLQTFLPKTVNLSDCFQGGRYNFLEEFLNNIPPDESREFFKKVCRKD